MASPLSELAFLLTRDKPVVGVVVSLSGGMASIATASGVVRANAGDGVMVGTRVRVVDGVARRGVVPANAYPV